MTDVSSDINSACVMADTGGRGGLEGRARFSETFSNLHTV